MTTNKKISKKTIILSSILSLGLGQLTGHYLNPPKIPSTDPFVIEVYNTNGTIIIDQDDSPVTKGKDESITSTILSFGADKNRPYNAQKTHISHFPSETYACNYDPQEHTWHADTRPCPQDPGIPPTRMQLADAINDGIIKEEKNCTKDDLCYRIIDINNPPCKENQLCYGINKNPKPYIPKRNCLAT